MSDLVIQATELSKKYTIKVGHRPADSLSEGIVQSLGSLWKRVGNSSPSPMVKEDVWSLKGASFEIKRGEIVGVIGRNGAGKSTLLKILSRITEPSAGRVDIVGRVGTLLEVGTGFHPELTGRDNIYLSGIILGMKKSDIDRKFDEIVEFSGIGQYIDTPVKRYSSGMYVRLAFAVGAHLDPEVLIVDEVLAVGDQQFQKKCLDKMHEIGGQGRTVIFVSHNMQAVSRLCERVICLEKGRVVADGLTREVLGTYLREGASGGPVREWPDRREAPGNEVARLRGLQVWNSAGIVSGGVDIREDIVIAMDFEVDRGQRALIPNVVLTNQEGIDLFETFDLDAQWRNRVRPPGRYRSVVRIPGNLLSEGFCFVSAACFSLVPHEVQFFERNVVAFQVLDGMNGDSARGDYSGDMLGVVRPKLAWETQFLPGLDEAIQPQKAA